MHATRTRCVCRLKSWGLFVALLALPCVLSGALQAEDVKPPEKKNSDTAPKGDPTQASSKLRNLLKGPDRAEVRVAAPVIRIPEIALKGLLQVEGKPPSAVLDIKGKGIVTVVEGSRVLLSGDDNIALIVKKGSVEGVQIEVPGVSELLIVK